MTIRTKDEMYNEIDTKIPDNSIGSVTPALTRSVMKDMFDTSRWRSFSTLSVNTTLDQGDHNGVVADDSGGSLIFTLPDNTTNGGAIFGILKSSSSTNTVTVNPAGSDTINGENTLVIDSFGEFVTVASLGDGQWFIINRNLSQFATIELDTTTPLPAYKAGQLAYDPDSLTTVADTGVAGVRVQIGQELHYLVYNNTVSQINNGQPVYGSGVDSTLEVHTIGLADASNAATVDPMLGQATSDIPSMSLGLVSEFGKVRGFDTSMWTEDVDLFVSTTAGVLTDVSPTFPNASVRVCKVMKSHATEGSVHVRVKDTTKSIAVKSYGFTSQGVGAGSYYIGGFYNFSTTDANLSQALTTISYGIANLPYNAHASVVFGGQGVVDTGQIGLRANGVTFDSSTGTLNTSDSVVIVDDITTVALDDYFETPEKFVGIVEFELYVVSGAPTAYSVDFNYGYSKYEDFGNNDITLTTIEVVGLGNTNDTNFDIEVLHHKMTGWTYAATGFLPGNGKIADYSDDLAPYDNIFNNEPFAWKRTNLNTFIDSNGSEGVLYRVTTGTNNTVQNMDMHISGLIESV